MVEGGLVVVCVVVVDCVRVLGSDVVVGWSDVVCIVVVGVRVVGSDVVIGWLDVDCVVIPGITDDGEISLQVD